MNIKNYIITFIKNPDKIIFGTLFSLSVTFIFAVYNGFLGLIYKDSWGMSIFVYYFCMILAKTIMLLTERKIRKEENKNADAIRRKYYIVMCAFMLFTDLCLIAPISLMIVSPKDVPFGIIPSITVAAYTTYKITAAIINYSKTKKSDNLIYLFLRELSVIDALVSILTLQHILIMVNGGMTNKMLIVSSVSSLVVLLIIIIFSLINLIKILIKNRYDNQ